MDDSREAKEVGDDCFYFVLEKYLGISRKSLKRVGRIFFKNQVYGKPFIIENHVATKRIVYVFRCGVGCWICSKNKFDNH